MLSDAGLKVVDKSAKKGELNDALKDADGVIIRSATTVNADFLAKSPKLKIVGRSGVGLDNVDVEACKARNITVVNSPEGPTRSVAEMALGFIIMAARKLYKVVSETKAGKWPKNEKGFELHGKTLGIVGSGAIGGTLARYCIALGMNVVAFDIVKIPELEALPGFEYVSRDDVFRRAHIISCHVPLVPQTRNMINKDTFAIMRDGVIIVNTSRGGVIDEKALLDALNSGKCGGAALDVFEKEPMDDANDALLKHPLCITTAHIGAQTNEANKRNTDIVCEKIIKHFQNSKY